MKPHIFKCQWGWICHLKRDDGKILDWGDGLTPLAAYKEWRDHMDRVAANFASDPYGD